MKKCSVCKIEKELIFFSKKKSSKDGFRSNCKACVKEDYQKNKEQIKQNVVQYRQNNKEQIAKKHAEYYQKNKERLKQKNAEWRKNNKQQRAKYNQDNKEQISKRRAKYRQDNKEQIAKYDKEYKSNRRKTDYAFRLITNRRNRRHQILKIKITSTKEDLGCTPEEWRDYLQAKFDENMTWDNYGSYWHVDEIIPCTAWDLTDEIEQKACFHYFNSQPLEGKTNIVKGGANIKDYTKEKEEFLKKLKELGII